MNRKYILALGLSLLLLGPTGVLGMPNQQRTLLTGAHARTVAQPGLPLGITDVAVVSNPVLNETTFSFKVKNNSGSALKGIETFILWLGPDRVTRGGQTTFQAIDIPANDMGIITLTLSNFFELGMGEDPGEFVLAVKQARTQSGVWESTLTTKATVAAMKNGEAVPVRPSAMAALSIPTRAVSASSCFAVSSISLVTERSPQAGSCPNDFCTQCRLDADSVCNDSLAFEQGLKGGSGTARQNPGTSSIDTTSCKGASLNSSKVSAETPNVALD